MRRTDTIREAFLERQSDRLERQVQRTFVTEFTARVLGYASEADPDDIPDTVEELRAAIQASADADDPTRAAYLASQWWDIIAGGEE